MSTVVDMPLTKSDHDTHNLMALYRAVCSDLQYLCLADVADKSGHSTAMLRNWRDGKTVAPRSVTLMHVADTLGYEITWYKR